MPNFGDLPRELRDIIYELYVFDVIKQQQGALPSRTSYLRADSRVPQAVRTRGSLSKYFALQM